MLQINEGRWLNELSQGYVCKERGRHGQSEYLWLPRLSSWASSSSRSSSQDEWETAVPAGDTCRPSHPYKSSAVSSLSTVNRQSRQISLHCFPVSPTPVCFPSPPRSPSVVSASSSLTRCFSPPRLQKPEWHTWSGLSSISILFPPSLSPFLWRLFLCVCPQEASTDQVLGPSAFPRA